ncbi:MAG: glycosyltransferase [Candidatus Magasanikbacteria bacterium]|nr:glycosyltransferase [Candidatus Magasanikbacteria bacterium]
MKLLYISRLNVLSPKAHVYNTLHTLEALAGELGITAHLITIFKKVPTDSLHELVYKPNGVNPKFNLTQLTPWGYNLGLSRSLLVRILGTVLDNIRLSWYLLWHVREYEVVYARDHLLWLTWAFARFVLRKPCFFESHFVLTKQYSQWCAEFCIKYATGAITIARALENFYSKFQKNITTIFCAAAEPERFAPFVNQSKSELRVTLNLPQDATILGYSGNLYQTGNGDSYGIEDIIAALPLLPKNVIFVGIGKRDDAPPTLDTVIKQHGVENRVLLVPWIPKSEVAQYLLASDILLIPAAGAKPGNSPTKVFEYLISERPIIAANTEPIAEVLTDRKTALLVDYKKPEAWQRAIEEVVNNKALESELVKNASIAGKEFSWSGRAKQIIAFIKAHT